MKKSISVILVAALVLFAFTACEQAPIDVNGYVPSALNIKYNGNGVLVGQKLNPADFSGTIVYKNGETAEYTGTYQLAEDAYAVGNNVVTAVIPTSATGSSSNIDIKGVVGTCNVTAYYPDELIIDASNGATEVEKSATYSAVPTEGVTVTASFNNGQTVDLDASYITASTTRSAIASDVEVKVSLSTKCTDEWEKDNLPKVTVSPKWTVDIVEEKPDTLPVKDMTDLRIVIKNEDPIVVGTQASAITFEVYGTDGETERKLNDNEYVVSPTFSSATFTTVGTYNFQVYLKDNTPVKDTLVINIVDTLSTDSITVSQKEGVTITAGSDRTLTANDFTVTAKLASDTSKDASGFVITDITPSFISKTETAGKKTVTVTFTWNNQEFIKSGVEVTIAAKGN